MAWASVADVLAQTGQTVSEGDVALASSLIDTYTGADEELPTEAISVRDRRTLRRACAWQAPWVRDRPDLLTQVEATKSSTASGVVDQRDSVAARMLAPMAMREIRNLSWVGTRTEVLEPVGKRLGRLNFLNEQSDECGTWTPL